MKTRKCLLILILVLILLILPPFVFTKRMVEGNEVRLEYDWRLKDKYGRLLAYVYLMDGTFLNAEIIKQGSGFAYTKHPYKHLEEFRRYEKEARAMGGDCGGFINE